MVPLDLVCMSFSFAVFEPSYIDSRQYEISDRKSLLRRLGWLVYLQKLGDRYLIVSGVSVVLLGRFCFDNDLFGNFASYGCEEKLHVFGKDEDDHYARKNDLKR